MTTAGGQNGSLFYFFSTDAENPDNCKVCRASHCSVAHERSSPFVATSQKSLFGRSSCTMMRVLATVMRDVTDKRERVTRTNVRSSGI